MAFTVADFDDLARLLAEHPEWRERLRPLILGDEILALPGAMTGVNDRLDRIEAVLELMVDRQKAFEQRQVEFDRRLQSVEDQLARLTEQVAELVRITQEHAVRMNRMDGRMGNIEGQLLEIRYDRNIRNWATLYYRHVERVFVDDLDLLDTAANDGRISQSEVSRLLDTDMLLRGQPQSDPTAPSTIVAVEISQTINRDDIDRANDHALTLRRAGYDAAALVGGNRLDDDIAYAASVGVTVDLRRAAA